MSIETRAEAQLAWPAQGIARVLAHPWIVATVLGAGMGLAAVAANGLRWPGHRSFLFALGLTLGLPVWRTWGPALLSGVIAGTMHATYRAAYSRKDTPLDFALLVLAPCVVSLLWGTVFANLPRRGRRWWFPLAAACVCLASPALSQIADALATPAEFWGTLTHFGKPWITHPIMGACGAAVGQALTGIVWFVGRRGDRLNGDAPVR